MGIAEPRFVNEMDMSSEGSRNPRNEPREGATYKAVTLAALPTGPDVYYVFRDEEKRATLMRLTILLTSRRAQKHGDPLSTSPRN